MDEELKILLADEIEGKVCKPVTKEEAKEIMEAVIEKMVQHCATKGGGGLSGPQIGIYKNFFVFMKREGKFAACFNPKFYGQGKKVGVIENCFSCPDKSYLMKRFKEIQAVYFVLDDKGEFIRKGTPLKGVPAVIFQHETAHLSGETIQFHGLEMKKDNGENKQQAEG